MNLSESASDHLVKALNVISLNSFRIKSAQSSGHANKIRVSLRTILHSARSSLR